MSIRLLAFLTVLSHLSFAGFRVVLPLIAHRLDEWRLLIAAMFLSGAALLVSGWFAARGK